MNRKERERHLAKIGTSITEGIEEDKRKLTQPEIIRRFGSPRISERCLDQYKQNCLVE